jgi:phospholipase C
MRRHATTGRIGRLGRAGLAAAVIAAFAVAVPATASIARPANTSSTQPRTATPIKHVVVIIGENHSFDNVFATYKPPAGQTVDNLLSEGIVKANGGLGPNASVARQLTAEDTQENPGHYSLTPKITGKYATLPQPNTTYVPTACSGQPGDSPDGRFPPNLANGPYQITKYVPYFDNHGQYGGGCEFYGAYVGDPLHRFYQMWQQTHEGDGKLFTWVDETSGDDNGALPPEPIYQGALSMGYYNMAQGDAPILESLASHFAMSDNYHQAVQGGTGANHIALGTGDAAYYQTTSGKAVPAPPGEIENPDPKAGTNNNYTQDGYGSSTVPNTGGSYSDCADMHQPGVGPIRDYLSSLPYHVFRDGDCANGHYYLLNNYNPGYNVDGSINTSPYTVPPQKNLPTIGGELSAHGISWGYFGEGYNGGHPTSGYCGICDPMQYSTQIMTNPTLRASIQHDSSDFDADVANGTLPAVSFLKPGDDDGHPGYSTLAALENFVAHTVTEVANKPSLWRSTAIFITFDEGGGYYDSGYIQPISFFGDGPRVPMIVVSPYTDPGKIDHTYTDHVSVLKFIEANWMLPPLSGRSEDNLPNPTNDGYVPDNRPAIGNLMTLFDFAHPHFAPPALPAVPTDPSPGVAPPHSDLDR